MQPRIIVRRIHDFNGGTTGHKTLVAAEALGVPNPRIVLFS